MSNQKKTRRFKFGISKKLLLFTIVLTVLICAISTVSGYFQFDDTIRKLYNDNGYVIGNIILNNVDHDKIAQYAQTWTQDEYYPEMESYLRSVQEASKAAYIYIVTVNEDQTVKYVYDSSGVFGGTDPVSAYFDEVWAAYTEGKQTESYMVRHSKKYGYLTSSMLPVKDSGGKVVALLFVDIWMQTIIGTLQSFILNMVLISVIVLALFSMIYWLFMRKNFIGPLMKIRKNVTEFAQNDTVTQTNLAEIQTEDEIQETAESIATMESDIIKYIDNIQTITAEKERIGAELNVATQIQADMLPRIFPAFPGRKDIDIFAAMDPAKEVGGDFYDFFLVDDDHLCMVMADVSGKGVPAALFMVIAKTLIKNQALLGRDPSEILYNVNNQLCDGNEVEMFVTVWLAVVELSTGKGKAANAGHEHPCLCRKGGKYELVEYRHSPAVAVMEGMKFREHDFELRPGDKLFVYTDGVPEATSAQKELFGSERMLDALNQDPEAEPAQVLVNVRAAVDGFVKEAEQFDDLTMLCLEYNGPEGGQADGKAE